MKKSPKIPIITIISTKENLDGTLDIEIEYQKDWLETVKRDLNKKKLTKKDIKDHFLKLLEKGLYEEDGYKIEKLGKPKA